ncbi:hypothetical protein RHS02_00036, partial [Rhizoctonia solani]
MKHPFLPLPPAPLNLPPHSYSPPSPPWTLPQPPWKKMSSWPHWLFPTSIAVLLEINKAAHGGRYLSGFGRAEESEGVVVRAVLARSQEQNEDT